LIARSDPSRSTVYRRPEPITSNRYSGSNLSRQQKNQRTTLPIDTALDLHRPYPDLRPLPCLPLCDTQPEPAEHRDGGPAPPATPNSPTLHKTRRDECYTTWEARQTQRRDHHLDCALEGVRPWKEVAQRWRRKSGERFPRHWRPIPGARPRAPTPRPKEAPSPTLEVWMTAS
jgi:hypothetical protein